MFLTDNFPPEGNAPASRTYEHAIRWVANGHKVTVITCAPNFPEGKIFEGYRNSWYRKSTVDGIDVVRVKTFISSNDGFVLRILDYMSFMLSGCIAGLFVRKPDVVVATSPQFFTAVAGWALSGIKRRPFVFELRDIWPASITAVGAMKKSFFIRLLEWLELYLYSKADKIVSVTESFKAELADRGVDPKKIAVVLNGVDLSRYTPKKNKCREFAEKYGLKGKFVVGYIGTHGMAHGLYSLADAAEKLSVYRDIVFLFAGGGAAKQKLNDYIENKKITNVVSIDRVAKELMPQLWSLCDVSLVHLKDTELFKSVIPSKLFESMGMGLPIVIGVPEGEATNIVRMCDAGIVVTPESPKSIAEAVLHLYRDRELYERHSSASHRSAKTYSRDALALKMEAVLVEVAQGRSHIG